MPTLPASTDAARRWLKALREHRDAVAWAAVDPEFKREQARLWVDANPEAVTGSREETIGKLATATGDPDAPYVAFALLWLQEVRNAFASVDRTGWGWSTRRRPVDDGYEVAVFARPVEILYGPSTFTPAVSIVMRRVGDAWLLAGFEGLVPDTAASTERCTNTP